MSVIVSPSLLSADFLHLSKDIEMVNRSQADWFHLDIMDGVFVPNISYGLPVVSQIKKNFREKEKEEGRNTMKFTYPAVFHKTEQGTYEGYFPDLACCYAKGDTLDEALEDAIHSAYVDRYGRRGWHLSVDNGIN